MVAGTEGVEREEAVEREMSDGRKNKGESEGVGGREGLPFSSPDTTSRLSATFQTQPH